MDKCVALTILVALSTRIATAGRYFRNDGHSFYHSFDQVDPYKWHDDTHSRESARSAYPQKFYKPRQEEGDNKEFWQSHHPEGWESHSRSDSWEYPDFPTHSHHNHNWNEQPSVNWNQEQSPNQGGHKPNVNHWSQGGNNQQGGWNQGGNRPNWNQGGSNSNTGSNQPSQFNPNQQGTPGNNNRPRPTSNEAGPGNSWGQPTTTAAATQAPLAIALCIRSCPVTSEYNPVCGSNNVTYGNAGRLECARYCGVDVTIRRNQPCPANNTQNFPPQPANNPNLPFPDPTRFTTIDSLSTTLSPRPVDPNLDSTTTSKFTIPQDVLNSIFTSTQSTSLAGGTTVDDNYDIDIRTRNNFLKAQPNFFYDTPPLTSS